MRNACLIFVLFVCLANGCTIGRQTEALEAQLRTQEDHLAQLAGQLERTRAELAAARQDSDALRAQLASDGQPVIPAEQAELFYRLHKIRIDSLQSSYLPGDPGQAGELQVMITPLDEFETALRIPGEVRLKVVEQTGSGNAPAVVAERSFSPAEVRENWTAGWVTSGFVLQWPWPAELPDPESLEAVQLVAEFETLDGRAFETTQTLKLRKSTERPLSAPPVAAHTISHTEATDQQPSETAKTPAVELAAVEQPVEEKKVPNPPSFDVPAPLPIPVPIPSPRKISSTSTAQADKTPTAANAEIQVPPAPAPPARTEHSDRRVIEEFPVYR